MRHAKKLCYAFITLALLQCTIGCDDKPAATTTPDTTVVNGVTVDEPAGLPPAKSPQEEAAPFPTEGNPDAKPGVEGTPAEPTNDDQAMADEIRASFASLNAEDRSLAEKQKICPVGDAPLGSMGPPVKVNVAGHDVFLCCEHCEAPLKAEPEKYLAKIGLKPAEDATVQ